MALVEVPRRTSEVLAAAAASELVTLPVPPPLPERLGELRVAAVMDRFSSASFAPECILMPLHPDLWCEQIRTAPPHLLLVESAWNGIDGEWQGKVERAPAVLRSLVVSCKHAGIPTAFWNKEDPLHFEAFLDTARLFDHVFTTDAASLPRYRRALGHDQVSLLPFALQPRTHHPVQDEPREASSVFAGAWYGRMPERCRDFEQVADALTLAGPLVIHDRNHGLGGEHQRFPARYAEKIKPSVPFEDTPALYRRHCIGVNMNTIKDSPTMFARRALELIGCNASVYGNHSLALRQLFGDLTVSTDDPRQLLVKAFSELREPNTPRLRHRRLRALRKALREHTWAHRLADIARTVFDAAPAVSLGQLWVLGQAHDEDSLERLVSAFKAQRGVQATLLLDLAPGLAIPPGARRIGEVEPGPNDWIAAFHPDDHYGAHYLEDLALGRAFDLGDVLGKGAWLACMDGAVVLCAEETEYSRVRSLKLRRCMMRRARWNGSISSLLQDIEGGVIEGEGLVALDGLSYVERGAGQGEGAWAEPHADEGLSLAAMHEMTARTGAAPAPGAAGADSLDGAQLNHLFNQGTLSVGTSITVRDGRLEVCSILEGEHDAAMLSAVVAPDVFEREGRLCASLQGPACSQLDLYLEALGPSGHVLQRFPLHRGVPMRASAPKGAAGYRIGALVRGRCVTSIDGIWLNAAPAEPLLLSGEGRLLVVTSLYPEDEQLYRYAFVHQRVLAYRERGLGVDVIRVSATEAQRSYVFDGVLVHVCPPAVAAATLKLSGHLSIAVHGMDPLLWEAVSTAAERQRVVVWLHGAEIQPWTRRSFNFTTDEERVEAIAASDLRMAFWRRLLSNPPDGMHLVFVSHTFAEQAWEDLGLRLDQARWSVIPNPIDIDLFRYEPKVADQRFKILSIRPHASRIYANDLVAAAIRNLADHPLFPQLHFTLVGDGPRWDEDFAGLDAYSNVDLRRGFLRRDEIAVLHRSHGIFLVPTRGDTQGVSRDEAMASGLVPVTNLVGAVGDFVNSEAAILADYEDVDGMVEGIRQLLADPERYRQMSRAAANRVREQSGSVRVTAQELEVLGVPGRISPVEAVSLVPQASPPAKLYNNLGIQDALDG